MTAHEQQPPARPLRHPAAPATGLAGHGALPAEHHNSHQARQPPGPGGQQAGPGGTAENGAGLPAGLAARLRERVLTASREARAAGIPVPDVAKIPPDEAFSRAVDALNGLLCTLGDRDWRTPVLRGLDAQGLVGHLAGVEYDVHRCLSGDPAVAEADHISSTQSSAARQAGRSPAQTRAEWREAAERTLALVRARDLGTEVALHGMRLPLGGLLVARAFELWTHENDIRRAAGLPPAVPDVATLRLMTRLAARLLPAAATRTGLRDPVSLRLVLTGPGGGTWDLAVGDEASDPVPVLIVADAVEFCRLVANRSTPEKLDPYITGDAASAARVLAVASALALD